MIKEALQYIIGLQQPRVQEIDAQKYFFNKDGFPILIDKCRSCDALEISTLTSLVDYIKESLADDFAAPGVVPKMIIHVESETEVRLVSVFNGDMDRWTIATVKARIPQIVLNQVAGNVEDKTVANYGDDGVSQKATIKTGLANVEDVIVPNPVKLRPFRTFHEIEQPEIDFVFRMRNGSDGVSCALFEADGGAWKFRAVHSIAEYLKEKLKGVENIAVLS